MPADFSVLVYDLPVIYVIISALAAPLLFLVAFSRGNRPWKRIIGCALVAASLVVAGGMYLTYRVIVAWDNPSPQYPAPSVGAALVSEFPGLVFHLLMLFVLGSALTYLILRQYRDLHPGTFLTASLVAGAICSSALIGFYVPLFGLFVPLVVPGLLYEVYYETRTRNPEFARHYSVEGWILVGQFFLFIVYLFGWALIAILVSSLFWRIGPGPLPGS